MRETIIILALFGLALVVAIMYSALVVASDADDEEERRRNESDR